MFSASASASRSTVGSPLIAGSLTVPGQLPGRGLQQTPEGRPTSMETADAIVVGAGHNGLVAANLLADAGWSVLVVEATPQPGGAVRSGQLTAPGYLSDLFSAFYPLGYASPVLRHLD